MKCTDWREGKCQGGHLPESCPTQICKKNEPGMLARSFRRGERNLRRSRLANTARGWGEKESSALLKLNFCIGTEEGKHPEKNTQLLQKKKKKRERSGRKNLWIVKEVPRPCFKKHHIYIIEEAIIGTCEGEREMLRRF